jgi:predicted dehydrogenase
MLEHQHFYESISKNLPPVISIDDGILAVKLIEKVIESADTHTEVLI